MTIADWGDVCPTCGAHGCDVDHDRPAPRATGDVHLEAGVDAWCPVCGRRGSNRYAEADWRADVELLPPVEAMRRLARHLLDAHDSVFATLLSVELVGAGLAIGRDTPAPDPFYPEGDAW
jgi:hypothetical protein